MTLNLKEKDEIWSKDGHRLGLANYVYHRTKDVNPQLELYERYLYVFSFDVGDDYYVPMDFITGDKEHGRFTLTVTMDEAMAKGWSRLPDFILKGESVKEELPKA